MHDHEEVHGLWIRACGDLDVVDVRGLETLQALIGGPIEGCQVWDHAGEQAIMTVYWHEEGQLIKGMQINHAITHFLHYGGVLQGDQVIVGDCVVVGPLDDEGNDTCVSEWVVEMMQEGVKQVNALVQSAYDREFSKIVRRLDKSDTVRNVKTRKKKGKKKKNDN